MFTQFGFNCPVCGLLLDERPWDGDSPSNNICPCCDIQFGYHDAVRLGGQDKNPNDIIEKRYIDLRGRWIKNGMKWSFPNDEFYPEPQNWSPIEQLKNIGVHITQDDIENIQKQ